MTTTIENSSITINSTPSPEAIVALAKAIEANANAINAVAEKLTTTAPTYGVYVEAPRNEE